MIGLPPELVFAVVASPDDDAPRLACADWLDEAGRADEAELVRLQVGGASGAVPWTTETRSRLVALLAATEAARLGPLWAECPSGRVRAGWERGFAAAVGVSHTLTPGLLRALASYPTIGTLLHMPDAGVPASALGPADLGLLAAIPSLTTVRLEVATPGLEWAHLEPLLALPRLRELSVTHRGRELVAGPRRRRWTAARSRVARTRSAGDAVEAARAAFGRPHVAELPSGGLAVDAPSVPNRAALLAALPDLRALRLRLGPLPRQLAEWASLRSLRLVLRGRSAFRPAEWRNLVGLRELWLDLDWDGVGPDWDAVLACVAELRELRVLRLASEAGSVGPAVASLPPLPELRVLEAARAGDAAELAAARWPALLEWKHRAWEPAFDRFDPRAAPELRLLAFGRARAWARPAAGWGERLPGRPGLEDPTRAALSADARRVEIPREGVSLRVPGWFADAPLPPVDPRTPEVVPLAAWREWDGDDLATRGRLDRIDGPPDPAAPAAKRVSTFDAHVGRESFRQVWRFRDRTYRLTWEGVAERLLSPDAVAVFAVAQNVGQASSPNSSRLVNEEAGEDA